MGKRKPTPVEYVQEHWFLVGMLTCVAFAAIHPSFGAKGGPLMPEYTARYGAVSVIFFLSGISLKTEEFLITLQHYRLHLFIQLFTFVLIPLITQILVLCLRASMSIDEWVLRGLVTVACMPPPVSSAVILTRAAQGNEAAAVFNSVLGSFLGILITPISLLINLGYTTLVPLVGTIAQLAATVLAPLMLGQVLGQIVDVRSQTKQFGIAGQCALLLVIYTTFCDTFISHDFHLTASNVLVTVLLVVLLLAFLSGLSLSLALKWNGRFSSADVAAAVFCSTHKSITLGVPILRVMFHGYSHLGQISLPLLVYHPVQIILGGLLVPNLKDWLRTQKTSKLPI